jgi:double-stranded uracil-DNA glycosylase
LRHRAVSFPPIATKKSRVLILGSMPGLKSLEMQQYYAHPQNKFWRIMSALFEEPIESYEQRVNIIKANNLALWDVLKCCERHGSLDTRIDNKTIEVNDFAGFFKKHPAITHVFFNGTKSEHEFRKRVLPELPESIRKKLILQRLPSTSPAMASLSQSKKFTAWEVVRQACINRSLINR